ncbi:glycoside hydrolase family 43 [Halothiobacillus diazotrophicus]|uniref:Glycoside hydrolase family 43 n=1 Tax=Halothiobacillus diazotrophicus TaxID=1860122 RepID=A0A191ZEX6_9GAMM|nr:HlyD family efflux transporter periplasmic adaptor subunit [Halothiobacillus diazotrophicus]ANJ66424.1 glycoside hydrolase family 43 [Halothiobacillus diazotrophicus]
MDSKSRSIWWVRSGVVAALVLIVGWWVWQKTSVETLPHGFASGNGRIEAVEVDVATTAGGRIDSIAVQEGQFVHQGELLATMDTRALLAQRREAESALARIQADRETAEHQVSQRESEQRAAVAVVAQQAAAVVATRKRLARTESLVQKHMVAQQTLDDDRAQYQAAQAALAAAQAQVAAANAAIATARSQVISVQASREAAQATIDRIQAAIDDSQLKAPCDGRIQYRVAEPGEVLPAGGRVLNLVNLGDVYMTFFLPTAEAGRVAIGANARIVLDAAPEYVFPATISYVASVAQFTPKTVETPEERVKLMFRIKARIPPALLKKYIRNVKTGLPGMAYVQLDPKAVWPTWLTIRLP